jgi:hypothetical protein
MTSSLHPWSLLDAAVQPHHPDCTSLAAIPLVSEPTASLPEGVADEVIAYGIQARTIYSDLRRLIGQTAGLLILAQASNKWEALDLAALPGALELWNEISERLGRLSAPRRVEAHLHNLQASYRLTGSCLSSLRVRRSVEGQVDLTEALGNLSAAYKNLQACSDDRFGMTMVDFRQSCCNCHV